MAAATPRWYLHFPGRGDLITTTSRDQGFEAKSSRTFKADFPLVEQKNRPETRRSDPLPPGIGAPHSTPPTEALSRRELVRKLCHIGFGFPALLLPWLTTAEAAAIAFTALAFNALLFPRLGSRSLYRADEIQLGFSPGILAYPAAVLLLILTVSTPVAAAIWAIMAFGDGTAALAAFLPDRRRLPWNRHKSWLGWTAFCIVGSATSSGLYLWCETGAPAGAVVLACSITTLACAFAETHDIRLTDNLTVPLVGAPLLVLAIGLTGAAPALPAMALAPDGFTGPAGISWSLSFLINLLFALAAWKLNTLNGSGALSALAVGTTVLACAGTSGYGLLMGFFILGSSATRLGRAAKVARGLAEPRRGARSARNVLANGSVPTLLALGLAANPGRQDLAVAYCASLAAAAFDTVSSEIGQWLGRRTYGITTFKPCPAGEDGGISLVGTAAGLTVALAMALFTTATGFLSPAGAATAVAGAIAGSTVDSLLGAVLERRGWVDNEAVNFACTYSAAAFALLVYPG